MCLQHQHAEPNLEQKVFFKKLQLHTYETIATSTLWEQLLESSS
jgi:hypothetical protein